MSPKETRQYSFFLKDIWDAEDSNIEKMEYGIISYPIREQSQKGSYLSLGGFLFFPL